MKQGDDGIFSRGDKKVFRSHESFVINTSGSVLFCF